MPKIILWAVDALEMNPEILDSAIAVLGPLASRLGASVQPVHVLTPSHLSSATDFSEIAETFPAHSLRPAVEHLLKGAMKKAALRPLLEPFVIAIESTSIPSAVDALSQHADSVDAEAIVVSSHGRRGFGRFFLGSFAETLMLRARRPVVVVHPGTAAGAFEKLIFPTDLSAEGHRYFLQTVEFARRADMEIHIVYCIPNPVGPILQSGVYLLSGGWMPTHAPVTEEVQALQKKIDHWAADAGKFGVRAKASIYSPAGGIAETILRVAKQEEASIIAMALQTGPIASVLLGSITREVARRSHCPVLVLRRQPAATREHVHKHGEKAAKKRSAA